MFICVKTVYFPETKGKKNYMVQLSNWKLSVIIWGGISIKYGKLPRLSFIIDNTGRLHFSVHWDSSL